MSLPTLVHLKSTGRITLSFETFCAAGQARSIAHMAGEDSERAWDEYDWERFLQEQDRKTDKYMELLEKYIDDPNRDEIVAREMGWCRDGDEEGEEWQEENELLSIDRSSEEEEASAEGDYSLTQSFEQHALYRSSFSLILWIDQLFARNTALQNDPSGVRLSAHAGLANAKLAAALSDEDASELGMTIAYLKRALKAITIALEAAGQLHAEESITRTQSSALQERLFQVRDGIIQLMGEYRGEWIRRHGSERFRS